MADTITQDGVADQTAVTAESDAHGAVGGGQEQTAIGETGGVQSEQGDNAKLGPDNLAPELEAQKKELLRDYHEKMQSIASEKKQSQGDLEKFKQHSGMLEKLMTQDWFKEAYQLEREKRDGGVTEEITPDTLQTITSDPKAFQEYLDKREKRIERLVSERLGLVQKETANIKSEREFETLATKHSDLRELNDKGALAKYLDKGYELEDAYRLAKNDVAPKQTAAKLQEEAAKLLAAKRAGAVDKTGSAGIRGSKVIKINPKKVSFDQLFDLTHNELASGNQDFVLEKE